MSERRSVLVLCTGNSCRSQMTAAYLESFAGDRFEVRSAGTRPVDEIHPLTLRVLAEDGLDLADRRPVDVRDLVGRPLDTLIVVCGGAARECPSGWPGVGERLEWVFEDPAAFQGPPDEALEEFRRVREEIKLRVQRWLEEE